MLWNGKGLYVKASTRLGMKFPPWEKTGVSEKEAIPG